MKSQDLKSVEAIIQYEFNNKALLNQAFLFYSEDSKVLATVGKRVIPYAVTHILTQYYGRFNKNSLFEMSNTLEGLNDFLNHISSASVYSENLSVLGLDKFIEASENDQAVSDSHILMESLLGAAALDSNWDLSVITDLVSYLLNIDFYLDNGFHDRSKNFPLSVRNWSVERDQPVPEYSFDSYFDEYGNYVYSCRIIAEGVKDVIEGEGNSRSEARNACAMKCYAYLVNNKLITPEEEEVNRAPKPETAVRHLEAMARQGYFAKPSYKYRKNADNTFTCRVSIEGYPEVYEATSASQAEATFTAAYSMLLFVLGYEE